jgi:hypothetical protein
MDPARTEKIPHMSLHINRFIDLIKAQESRGGRDVTLSLRDAKDLHADITKLLLVLEQLRTDGKTDEVIKIELTGGTF